MILLLLDGESQHINPFTIPISPTVLPVNLYGPVLITSVNRLHGTAPEAVLSATAVLFQTAAIFGIVETSGFPKDSYYLYRSQWNKEENTLHLVTAWDSNNMLTSGGKTPVWVYSNAPKVELYRNGTLIGTTTRQEHTSAAGHTYYTYSSVSNNSSVCTASNGNGSDATYAVFNVAFEKGTISAKAFDENGEEITGV